MEEDIYLKTLTKKNKNLEKHLDNAITKAEEILDFESAHDPEIIQALTIVKNFIIRKKRICYGGTAINALLPKKDKFYDPEYTLPDYDFITYEADNDVKELVSDLKNAGFTDVLHRVGMHEGTKKILVNFIAIADITEVNRDTYNVFLESSKRINNIHYTNENMLRMMMYLEISRPRGEVSRWKKVVERLELLNKHFPIKSCVKTHRVKDIPENVKNTLFNFIIQNQRVLANLDLENIYRKSLTKKDLVFSTKHFHGKVVFYTPNAERDVNYLNKHFNNLKIIYHPARGEYLSRRVTLVYEGIPIALLVEETACHSYNNIKTDRNQILHIASLETLITLHLSLYFFSVSEKEYLCDIGKAIRTHKLISNTSKSQFDVFPVACSGYQKGYATLLREKVDRIEEEKEKKRYTLKKRKNSN
uniref:Poly(A) polymerase catalytic subunit domain-containing protein n=1 Tax=viral metagenome TaxID=1070528 RepID=A0A6C0D7R4_9ZZZZ